MPLPTDRHWTVEETDALRRMIAEGFSRAAIADALNRSTESISKRSALLRRNTPPRFLAWTQREDERLIEMRRAGLSASKIARELENRTPGAVLYRLTVLGPGVHGVDAPQVARQELAQKCDREGVEKHLAAIFAANPNGFMAWSEKRVGVRGIAPCAPAFFPLKRAA